VAGSAPSPPPRPSVSVCFPAYNEAAQIREVVEEAAGLLRDAGLEHEILACDDGSADATGRILDELAAALPVLRVLHNERNRGMQYTFERLYREAAKEFVFLNAADRQWPTRCLFDLLPLAGEYDIVVAARRDKHYGVVRRIVSAGFNAIPRRLFGVETHDAGAVKLVRREIYERFPPVSRSPFAEAERMIRAARAGYRIAAVPVATAPRRAGRARGGDPRLVLASLADVWRVWRDLRR
jgi:glycosyltransferase involved in cell wall biosynthesis